VRAEPAAPQQHIVYPTAPCRVAKVSTTVTAAEQIHQEHCIPAFSEQPRLQRCHATGLVHLFRERMHIEQGALACSSMRMKQAEALANYRMGRGKKECVHGQGWYYAEQLCRGLSYQLPGHEIS
jgi:hypothetical protein